MKRRKELFFAVTPEMSVELSELKPSELLVFLYVRSRCPFEDSSIDIDSRDMAEALGLKPRTASDALKSLVDKSWLDIEIIAARVRVRAHKGRSVDRRDAVKTASSAVKTASSAVKTASSAVKTASSAVKTADGTPETLIQQGVQEGNRLNRSNRTTTTGCCLDEKEDLEGSDDLPPLAEPEAKSPVNSEDSGQDKNAAPPPELLERAARLGVGLEDPGVKAALREHSDRLPGLMATIESYFKRKTVDSPNRVFIAALKKPWTPEAPEKSRQTKPSVPAVPLEEEPPPFGTPAWYEWVEKRKTSA